MSVLTEARAGAFAGTARATVGDYATFIYAQRQKGVGVQNIARMIGKSTEDVHRFLSPADHPAAARPPVTVRPPREAARSGRPLRDITADDLTVLRHCEGREISQSMAAILMKTSIPTVRRCLERLADMRVTI